MGHIPSPPHALYPSTTANHRADTVPNRASILPTPIPTVINNKRLPPTHPQTIVDLPPRRIPTHPHIPPYHTYPVCIIESNHNTYQIHHPHRTNITPKPAHTVPDPICHLPNCSYIVPSLSYRVTYPAHGECKSTHTAPYSTYIVPSCTLITPNLTN